MKDRNSEIKINRACLSINIDSERDNVKIKFTDDISFNDFFEATISSKRFIQALGRLAYVPCEEAYLSGVDILNKEALRKRVSVEIPEDLSLYSKDSKEKLEKICKKRCPKGWIPDLYFDSKSSFTKKNGKYFVNFAIRKYVYPK